MLIDYSNVNIYQDNRLILKDVNFQVEEGEFIYIIGKVGVFFLGHAGFDHMAAVGRVVFFLQALTSFLARQGA